MKNNCGENRGIELLLQRFRKIFRVPENLNHYSKEDYLVAEKKFIKYSIKNSCA
jgi:hypothetical protein